MIFAKTLIAVLFVAVIIGGVDLGLRLVDLPGGTAKVAGVLVLGLTTGLACIGVYHWLGINSEDLL